VNGSPLIRARAGFTEYATTVHAGTAAVPLRDVSDDDVGLVGQHSAVTVLLLLAYQRLAEPAQ
jgi:hypothetical protein